MMCVHIFLYVCKLLFILPSRLHTTSYVCVVACDSCTYVLSVCMLSAFCYCVVTEPQDGDVDLEVLKKKIEKSRKHQKKTHTTSRKH